MVKLNNYTYDLIILKNTCCHVCLSYIYIYVCQAYWPKLTFIFCYKEESYIFYVGNILIKIFVILKTYTFPVLLAYLLLINF